MDKQAEIARIKAEYDARNREIDRQHRNAMGRMILGTAISGLGALPFAITKNPMAASGVGGALYEFGQGMVEGDTMPDLLKRAGAGAGIGAVAGKALPAFVNSKAGQAVGNQASKLYNYLADTKVGQKVAEIAPKVEEVLMTDIKAYNPFKKTQTAYHGSTADFNKFDNAYIGTGEGAQVHGYGHYTAKNKNIADERYRKRLLETKALRNIKDENVKNKIGDLKFQKHLYENKFSLSDVEKQELANINTELDFYKSVILDKYQDKNKGQLYKLLIPKDDVMLREGADSYKRHPKVQKALNKLFEDTGLYKEWDEANGFNRRKKFATDDTILWDIQRDLGKTPQEANDLLNKYGIKGISYNGGVDGEAAVVFNPDDIEIVRKYYNEDGALDYFKKLQPNLGAVANSFEQTPVNTKEWKQYAKNNLIGNSVDVPGYTTVNFTNKNLGKDYPYNMPEYPTLLEDLANSQYAFSTNYYKEADRLYDHLVNDKKGLYDYIIEVIKDNEGNIHHNYKMMKNINRGDKP